jgi:hypothetical protein
MMDRRRFLQLTSGAALGLSATMCGKSGNTPSFAGPTPKWGDPRPDQLAAMVPLANRPEGMLEIFVLGGLCPWDTFYVIPEYGDPARGGEHANTQWWTFQEDGDQSPAALFDRCGGGERPIMAPYATDAIGKTVNLGPFIYPLRDRPDILKRMRIDVMSHDALPHHAAIPIALSGVSRNSARMAALGTHVQRYFAEHGDPSRSAPYSYVIYQNSLDIDGNGDAASAVGFHPSSARQMAVRLGPDNPLPSQLAREAVGGYRDQLDTMVGYYQAQYQDRMRRQGNDIVARTPDLQDFEAARRALQDHESLQQLLTPESLAIAEAAACGEEPMPDEFDTGLRLATRLLTSPTNRAQYVNVMEGGLYPDPAGLGYDTHAMHVLWSSRNMVHLCKQLAAHINEPGENDPNKLDLDKHLIVLNTEFGRTPYREFSKLNPFGTGTNHWCYGYATIVIGGFIDEEKSGVTGAIGEDGYAIESFHPSEHRAAMLLAQGIWPFSPEGFRVSDVRDAKTELDAAMFLKEQILEMPA